MELRKTSAHTHVLDLLALAHSERTNEGALQVLRSALTICEDWDREAPGIDSKLLIVQVLSDLAVEEPVASKRGERWSRAISIAETGFEKTQEPRIASALGFVAVDCFQDLLSDLRLGVRLGFLRLARDSVDRALRHDNDVADTAALLARKSSILRHLAIGEVTAEQQKRRVEEAFRCATKAAESSRTAETLLELALAGWALAAKEDSDQKYADRFRKAEEHLRDQLLKDSEVAQLSIARLYRLTFRPLDACEQYRRITGSVKNRRRVLRDSYIYAEAAIQLWYRTYPEEMVRQHLLSARQLIEEALASGIKTGRHVVDLCQLGAIIDGAPGGTTALSEIFPGGGRVSWEEVIRLAAQASLENSAGSAFVLGINDGSVWTSLGTFICKFLQDDDLAEELYRNAVKLDPRDPVALTNMARLLVRKGDPVSLGEARRNLQKAEAFADRRFTWWRTVQAELLKMEGPGQSDLGNRPTAQPALTSAPVKNIKEVIRRFKAIEGLEDKHQRGIQLEQVVYDLAKLTIGVAESSYQIKRSGGGVSQIDGYFRHGSDRYRVECKWEQDRIGQGDIFLFEKRLDAFGVAGLIISMSGFAETAVQAASELRGNKVILLMDGDEARAVFGGRLNFDELLTRKRAYFDQRSEVYRQVRPDDN